MATHHSAITPILIPRRTAHTRPLPLNKYITLKVVCPQNKVCKRNSVSPHINFCSGASQAMEIEFTKLSGAGNDFIVIDNRDAKLPESDRRALFSKWCRRGMAVGADGVLLVEHADAGNAAHFRMRYYNADGGEAETCGNGSRCIARFAFEKKIAPREMTFQTLAGDYHAAVLDNGHVRLQMSDAHELQMEKLRTSLHDADTPVEFVNTGVPHAVVFVEDLDNAPVIDFGRRLRHDAAFAPAGTNVNFVKITSPSQLRVRTYERGVEDETLACGTGCIASTIMAARRGLITTPAEVTTASGEKLLINFTPTETGASDVTLQGSADIIFRGYITL